MGLVAVQTDAAEAGTQIPLSLDLALMTKTTRLSKLPERYREAINHFIQVHLICFQANNCDDLTPRDRAWLDQFVSQLKWKV